MVGILKNNLCGPLDQGEVSLFESKIGGEFPVAFIRFLEKNNGVIFEGNQFHISGDQGSTNLKELYGLGVPVLQGCDIREAYVSFLGRISEGYIAIGQDDFGNQVCIDVKMGEGVYFWDHEEVNRAKALVFLAKSFSDFLLLLKPQNGPLAELEFCGTLYHTVDQCRVLMASGANFEIKNGYGRTLIEEAVIKNRIDIVMYLAASGVDLGQSLQLAEKNFRFFPEYRDLVDFLKKQM